MNHTEQARELFNTWMRTRPAGVYQSWMAATEAARLIDMIAAALTDAAAKAKPPYPLTSGVANWSDADA